MSDLQNQAPANTYKGLLQVGDYTNGIDSNSEYVQDGEGTNSALSLSTTKVGVNTQSPSADLDVNGDIESTTLTTSGSITAGSASEIATRLRVQRKDVNGAWDRQPSLYLRTAGSEDPSSKNYGVIFTNSDGVAIHSDTDDVNENTYTPHFLVTSPDGSSLRGRVGINSDNPDATLHIINEVGTSGVDGIYALKIESPEPTIYLDDTTNTGGMGIQWQAGSTGGGLRFFRDNDDSDVDLIIDLDGRVGIGTDAPNAPLEVSSTTGGVIMPRMTTTQRNAISSPTDGEMIYNTTTNKFQGRANGAWVDFH